MTLLWDREEPIGICVFCTPALSLSLRRKFFGLSGRRSKLSCRALNRQLVTLTRVVIHPKYRGAGLASLFVRRSCESCAWPWIEALAEMGKVNPFFERAGFVRVGKVAMQSGRSVEEHSGIYGGKRRDGQRVRVSDETHRKSLYAEPEYFVFDNRGVRR